MDKYQEYQPINDLRRLLQLYINRSCTEEELGFYVSFGLHTLRNHKFLSADGHSVGRSMTGLVEKFKIHGFEMASDRLNNLYEHFINNPCFENLPQPDFKWNLLSLLIHIAYNPTGHLKDFVPNNNLRIRSLTINEESPDGRAILSKDLNLKTDYDSDALSEWSDGSDTEYETSDIYEESSVSSSQNFYMSLQKICNESRNTSDEEYFEDPDIQSAHWLLIERLQPPWWELSPGFEPQSYVSSSNLAEDWNGYVRSLTYDIIEPDSMCTLSEYCVLRELIWLLYVPTTPNICKIFYRDKHNVFRVHNNVTLPSLLPRSFHEFLQPFCDVLTMLYTLEVFLDEVIDIEGKLAPFTYKAYRESIVKLLKPFKDMITATEDKVRAQEEVFTLFSLRANLKPYINKIHSIHLIHKECILDWHVVPSNVCVFNLLNQLYNNCNAVDSDVATLSFIMFSNCIKVFLDIIALWLRGGALEDWRDEFCITCDKSSKLGDYFLRNGPDHDNLSQYDESFLTLTTKLLNAGQSIRILQKLDKMENFIKERILEEKLFASFCREVFKALPKVPVSNEKLEFTNPINNNNNEKPKHRFIPEIKNPILREMFAKYLKENPLETFLNAKDTHFVDELSIRLKIDSSLAFHYILENALNNILEPHCSKTCKLVVMLFKKDFELELHLEALENVMLMQSGGVLHDFYIQLFQEMDACNECNTTGYFLNYKIDAILSYSKYMDLANLFSVYMEDDITIFTNKLECLNKLKILYNAYYPLSIVITQKELTKYDECMQFLLQINWSMWALQHLAFTNAQRYQSYNRSVETISKKLQLLKFWLLHSISSIHSYVYGQVLSIAKARFQQKLDTAGVHDELYRAHAEFIDYVHDHCLLNPKYEPIKKIVLQFINLVEMIRSEWEYRFNNILGSTTSLNEDQLIDATQICTMESLYLKCHACLRDTLIKTTMHDKTLLGLCFLFDYPMPEPY